ncbi:uncharacterized protein LOC109504459 [Harpegnathos saltator]|uniref:uncharacterized protein LOC109504459 n=1 Tax=Harpegnathos saltator TaxID=610380 RepID=UPI000948C984|nr:uncharacterized protein LOC109504459 [Harpegnathos saltator]
MSEEICHRNQDRLDHIFEQVKVLSGVVDELRTEVNNLKEISLNAKREEDLFECTKVINEIDHVRPCVVVGKVKTYLENVRDLAATEEICQLAENNQVISKRNIYISKSGSISPSRRTGQFKREKKELSSYKHPAPKTLSTIYDGLKSFKNKLVKIIHSVPVPQLSLKSTKNKCVTSSRQRQIRFSQREKKGKFYELDRANGNDVCIECIDINDEPDDSTDTLLTSDASADVTTCLCQEDNEKLAYSSYRDVRTTDGTESGERENNAQASSLINNNRLIIRSNWITDELSKGRVKQTFLKNKFKKYKICSCGSQCPYALYKLPCCQEQNNSSEKKTDEEDGGLTLECSSFEEQNNFPKFVNMDARREDCCNECLADFSLNESSLSVDVKADVCCDYGKPENVIDEIPKRRTRTHVMREAKRNDNAISYFRTENEPLTYLEGNQQRYRTRMEDFTHDYRSIRNNDKPVQCSSATLRAVRRISVKTSTPDFRRGTSASRPCRVTDMIKHMNFPKVIIPKQMKMNNMHTQTEKHSYLNRLRSVDLPIVLDVGNEQCIRNIHENGNKKIIRNMYDFPREKAWSRAERYDTQFALLTEQDGETYLNKSSNQASFLSYRRDGTPPLRISCPYRCDRVLAEKHKNLAILMSRFAKYHPSLDEGF